MTRSFLCVVSKCKRDCCIKLLSWSSCVDLQLQGFSHTEKHTNANWLPETKKPTPFPGERHKNKQTPPRRQAEEKPTVQHIRIFLSFSNKFCLFNNNWKVTKTHTTLGAQRQRRVCMFSHPAVSQNNMIEISTMLIQCSNMCCNAARK